jgi:hypothetical protein
MLPEVGLQICLKTREFHKTGNSATRLDSITFDNSIALLETGRLFISRKCWWVSAQVWSPLTDTGYLTAWMIKVVSLEYRVGWVWFLYGENASRSIG